MEPLTRKEFFLNAIAEGTPTPPPLTREERYLAKIAENTGGDSLPPIEEGDDGKVLTVSSGEAAWADVSGLPEIGVGDEGKVLTVDDGGAAWATASGGCFIVTSHWDDVKDLAVLDYTWNEIYEASQNMPVIYKTGGVDPDDGPFYQMSYLVCVSGFIPSNVYDVFFVSFPSGNMTYERYLTDSADGYPEYWDD